MTDTLKIDFKWLPHGIGLGVPHMQSTGAAGCDMEAALGDAEVLTIEPGKRTLVPCGFCLGLPIGFEAQVRPRSGLAAKFGVTVLNSPGTIDADYRGEVKVILINHGDAPFDIRRGDRIAQLVVASVTQVQFRVGTQLDDTARGADGFGSTGHVAAE